MVIALLLLPLNKIYYGLDSTLEYPFMRGGNILQFHRDFFLLLQKSDFAILNKTNLKKLSIFNRFRGWEMKSELSPPVFDNQ